MATFVKCIAKIVACFRWILTILNFTGIFWFYQYIKKCVETSTPTIQILEKFIYNDVPLSIYPQWEEVVSSFLTQALIAVFLTGFVKIYVNWKLRPRLVENGRCFEPERMQSGSDLLREDLPAFQAQILGLVGKTYVKSGQAFRVDDYLITAKHVLDGYSKLMLTTPKGEFVVDADRFSLMEGDAAKLLLTPDIIQTLGLASAKLVPNVPEGTGLFCKATGFGSSSLGLLQAYPAFGFAKYLGSTTKGFSGAPYFSGNRVYGMHLGGGSENLGYVSAYLSMLIKTRQESSEDYLFSQVKKFQKMDFERSPYDPDEYRLRIGDRYYLVDSETLSRLQSRNSGVVYEGESAMESNQVQMLLETVERELNEPAVSGNSPAPLRAAEPVAAMVDLGLFEREQSHASPPKVVKQRATSSSTPKRLATSGLKQMRAQRDEALQSMSQCLKLLKQQRALLQDIYSNKRLTQLPANSNLGELLSAQSSLSEASSRMSSLAPSTT